MEPGKWTLLAEDYLPIFRKLGVTCVIRFNKRCYDRRRLTEGGIKHVDLFYEDGGNPSEEILERFLEICENTKARNCNVARYTINTILNVILTGLFGHNIRLYHSPSHGDSETTLELEARQLRCRVPD